MKRLQKKYALVAIAALVSFPVLSYACIPDPRDELEQTVRICQEYLTELNEDRNSAMQDLGPAQAAVPPLQAAYTAAAGAVVDLETRLESAQGQLEILQRSGAGPATIAAQQAMILGLQDALAAAETNENNAYIPFRAAAQKVTDIQTTINTASNLIQYYQGILTTAQFRLASLPTAENSCFPPELGPVPFDPLSPWDPIP